MAMGFLSFLPQLGSNPQAPTNSAGGFLGLFNTTNTDSSQNQMIVIEFDSFSNPEWDPPYEHVGINKNSISSSSYAAWNASLHSGDPADAWVSYNATSQTLNLRWSYGAGNDSGNTSLSYQVDLREVLPERVSWIFSFHRCECREPYYSTLGVLFKLEYKKERKFNEMEINSGINSSVGVLILGGLVACRLFCRSQTKTTQKSLKTITSTSMNDDLEKVAIPKRFSYRDLTSSTNNFSDDRKLGKGGFGCVYKGYLSR